MFAIHSDRRLLTWISELSEKWIIPTANITEDNQQEDQDTNNPIDATSNNNQTEEQEDAPNNPVTHI